MHNLICIKPNKCAVSSGLHINSVTLHPGLRSERWFIWPHYMDTQVIGSQRPRGGTKLELFESVRRWATPRAMTEPRESRATSAETGV